MAPRDYMTIGEVVERLSPSHPDLTISKLRFLEEEGLVNPERTPGGYRKFSKGDLARVELILRLQKEHFLPLAVIGQRLADFDRGKPLPEISQTPAGAPGAVEVSAAEGGRMPLDDTQAQTGIPSSFVRELTEFGLLQITKEEDEPASIDRADLAIVHAAWDLRRFGVEPRHLRMYQTAAEREAVLFQQILMPAARHRTPETKQRLAETLGELQQLTGELKARLLSRALRHAFDDDLG
ncbi:MAG: MerR family transcriptional regulator [Coriobacteriales bacterium]|nr:MerR family transcriptional regulator [Coriobacteriales bacterium]